MAVVTKLGEFRPDDFFFLKIPPGIRQLLYGQSCENPADNVFFLKSTYEVSRQVVVAKGFVIATKPSAEGVSVCGWAVKPPPDVKKR